MKSKIFLMFLLFALLIGCQNMWEINPLEQFDTPALPKSGEMASWEIDEFRSRMPSLKWVRAVVNDSTLGGQLLSRLNTLAGNTSTKVEASLLMIRALSQVNGVPNSTNRVVTYLFPELIASGLLNGFNPLSNASTQALRSLVANLLQTTNTNERTVIIQAMVQVHLISANNLSVTPPGINWYGTTTFEELGKVAQIAVGSSLIYALYANTSPANDVSKIIAFLNSPGNATDLSANFNGTNVASALQDLFNAFDKNANNTNPLYEHIEPIGDLLPF